jgi:hypothetical protein
MKANTIISKLGQEFCKENPDIILASDLVKQLKEMTGVCKECEADFFKIRYDQVFCSEKCSNKYRQRKFRERKTQMIMNI